MAFGNATKGYVKSHSGSGGSGGTTNYSELSNKPQINGVALDGNKTSEELGIKGGGLEGHYIFIDDYSSNDKIPIDCNLIIVASRVETGGINYGLLKIVVDYGDIQAIKKGQTVKIAYEYENGHRSLTLSKAGNYISVSNSLLIESATYY